MEPLLSQMVQLESFHPSKDAEASLSLVIADDERHIQQIIARSLKDLGHEVVGIGATGAEAVALAAQHQPDMMILDVDMPVMDGLEAARIILESRCLPIVLSTGRSDSQILQRARALEIHGYLVKPFTKEQLKSTISTARASHEMLLESKLKIARLTHEIEEVKAVDDAVALLMEKFRIDRKEALEKLQMAAQARSCALSDAARAISASLKPRATAAA